MKEIFLFSRVHDRQWVRQGVATLLSGTNSIFLISEGPPFSDLLEPNLVDPKTNALIGSCGIFFCRKKDFSTEGTSTFLHDSGLSCLAQGFSWVWRWEIKRKSHEKVRSSDGMSSLASLAKHMQERIRGCRFFRAIYFWSFIDNYCYPCLRISLPRWLCLFESPPYKKALCV